MAAATGVYSLWVASDDTSRSNVFAMPFWLCPVKIGTWEFFADWLCVGSGYKNAPLSFPNFFT